ncbi:MAG TPA: transcriptional regulator [Chitinophagales bacterium]|nr:transcriptional regulator [Chitinophagales bacterium]HRH53817.1 transcriptional regulator [Chitinophagales bacterium]
MKYKIIKTKSQYKTYCKMLEELVYKTPKSKLIKEEIALLTLLIEKWDEEHSPFTDKNPIVLIQALMEANNLKSKDLVKILGVSKGLISDILSYKKGLSKANIRILASYFKISQEALNKPYKLKLQEEYA